MKVKNINDENRNWLLQELEDSGEEEFDNEDDDKEISISYVFSKLTFNGFNENRINSLFNYIKKKEGLSRYLMSLIFSTSYVLTKFYDEKFFKKYEKCNSIDEIIDLVTVKDLDRMCFSLSNYNAINESVRKNYFKDSLNYKDFLIKIFQGITNDYVEYLNDNYLDGIYENYALIYEKYKDKDFAFDSSIEEYAIKLKNASIYDDFSVYEKKFLKILNTYCKYNQKLIKEGKKIDPYAKYIINLKNKDISNIIINSINNDYMLIKLLDTYLYSKINTDKVNKKKIKKIIVKKGKK